ncbi:hypothetical protein GCM10009661_03820 [Catellatospora chokoriensis]|uniref:Uncharacterized protein n=1 Tax=Catellatospora chokoriensis TaxID=310353 RepID=A0A8J3NSI4_9ACTN|nr:hypothetical protein Cch02nite_45190 [Catellatospora chokoriensis]
MHPEAREVGELRQFLLTGEAKFEPRCGDGKPVQGPQVSEHGHDPDERAVPVPLVFGDAALSAASSTPSSVAAASAVLTAVAAARHEMIHPC